MSGSQIRAIFREPISSSVWGRLENFRTNQVRRYRAPRLKPEGLVSGGGDVPPPPGCGNPLMQEFITKLQEKDGSLSRLPAGQSQKPNEYGGCPLILSGQVRFHRFCFSFRLRFRLRVQSFPKQRMLIGFLLVF